jgi:predicted DNA-binding ArsR family transcriptional regulator
MINFNEFVFLFKSDDEIREMEDKMEKLMRDMEEVKRKIKNFWVYHS